MAVEYGAEAADLKQAVDVAQAEDVRQPFPASLSFMTTA